MSDMAQQTQTPQNKPTEQSNSVDTLSGAEQRVNETFTQDDVTKAVESARKQEKDKLYQRLNDLDSNRDELIKKLDESTEMLKVLMAERDEAQRALAEKAKAEMTAEELVAERLKALEEKEAQMQAQLERVAEEAAKRVRDSELRLYRANKIAESGLTLTELVAGQTEAEIDASIKRAREREEAIFSKAREKARAELSAQMPKPAPVAVESVQDSRLIDPSKKFELANLSTEDFNRLKSELLAKARGSL